MCKFLLILLTISSLTGCVATLKTLEEKRGKVYVEKYDASIDTVFKITKSIIYRSHCAASASIYDDELNYKFYAIFRLYGLIPEYIWLIILEPITENSTRVELVYSPYIISEGCFTQDLFTNLKVNLP